MMKRIIFACAAILAASTPALAQYYPYPPQREYGPPPGYGPPPWARPQPWGGGGGGYYYERPVVMGNVCVTARGNCRTRYVPANSGCSCNIPGFGPKRGQIVANNW
jgi:hypothetical protein